MIEFFSENEFELEHKQGLIDWIESVIQKEEHKLGDISYIFCDDEYLLKLNQDFLEHDTLTDIISFDYSLGKQVHGEIYISIERVVDNANKFKTEFQEELHRVMIHGILHYCGYKDKTAEEKRTMRAAEDKALQQRAFL